MARAGPSRSQRAFQSQPNGTRRNTRRADPEDEDEGEEDAQTGVDDEEGHHDVDMEVEINLGNKGDELSRKANNLVRLALFTEHRRMPLRRDEINKKGVYFLAICRLCIEIILRVFKVLGSSARSFNTVFEQAQKILRKTFGMEFVELRSRAETQADGTANANKDDDLEEARNATGMKKKGVVVSTFFFFLSYSFVI